MIVGTVVMIAGITGEITVTTTMNRKGIATDWIGGGKMLGIAGGSIQTTPAISGMAIPIIAKDSAVAMLKGIAKMAATADGNWTSCQSGSEIKQKAAGYTSGFLLYGGIWTL